MRQPLRMPHCQCGWFEGPFPGRGDAENSWCDHQGEDEDGLQ